MFNIKNLHNQFNKLKMIVYIYIYIYICQVSGFTPQGLQVIIHRKTSFKLSKVRGVYLYMSITEYKGTFNELHASLLTMTHQER